MGNMIIHKENNCQQFYFQMNLPQESFKMKKCNTEVGKKRKIENKIEQKTNNMLKH